MMSAAKFRMSSSSELMIVGSEIEGRGASCSCSVPGRGGGVTCSGMLHCAEEFGIR